MDGISLAADGGVEEGGGTCLPITPMQAIDGVVMMGTGVLRVCGLVILGQVGLVGPGSLEYIMEAAYGRSKESLTTLNYLGAH